MQYLPAAWPSLVSNRTALDLTMLAELKAGTLHSDRCLKLSRKLHLLAYPVVSLPYHVDTQRIL